MKVASIAEVRSRFAALVKASEGAPVVVTRGGRPVAVIIGVQDKDEVERLVMAHSPHLRAILDRGRRQFRDGQWHSEEEFWEQFDRALPSKRAAKPMEKKKAEAKANNGAQRAADVPKPRRRP